MNADQAQLLQDLLKESRPRRSSFGAHQLLKDAMRSPIRIESRCGNCHGLVTSGSRKCPHCRADLELVAGRASTTFLNYRSGETLEETLARRRLKSCVERWPNAESGTYDPRCCRFPKSCSPHARIEAFNAGNLTDSDLESL